MPTYVLSPRTDGTLELVCAIKQIELGPSLGVLHRLLKTTIERYEWLSR